MATCSRKDCKRLAEVAPKVIVPHAIGMPIEPNRRYAVLLGLKICRRCAMQMDAVEQAKLPNFAAFVRRLAQAQTKRLGLPYQEPDFDRATIERVKLNSPEYNRLAPRLEHAPAPAAEIDFIKDRKKL